MIFDLSSDIFDCIKNNKVTIAYAAAAVCGIIAIRKYMSGPMCRSKAKLNNKTVLITGANTGIGKATALDLAARGARVLLACRDYTKAKRAAEDIRKATGNKNVAVYILDLSSLESVRKCASEVIAKEPRIDILINNAGVFASPQKKTVDGFEMHFGTNHLGHFLLTNLLLDLLKKSSPSRIVNVSALAHIWGHIKFDDIVSAKVPHPVIAYSNSKLANVLFTRELSKRLKGTKVTANSLHPGVIRTELLRNYEHTLLGWIFFIALIPIQMLIYKTLTQGAQTMIYCAVAEELEGISGKYFSDCAVKQEAPQARDDETAMQLWALSAEMVGLVPQS